MLPLFLTLQKLLWEHVEQKATFIRNKEVRLSQDIASDNMFWPGSWVV